MRILTIILGLLVLIAIAVPTWAYFMICTGTHHGMC